MYNVLTLNKIAACGTDLLDKSKYTVSDDEKNPDAILVRSASMHEMELPGNLLAIATPRALTQTPLRSLSSQVCCCPPERSRLLWTGSRPSRARATR